MKNVSMAIVVSILLMSCSYGQAENKILSWDKMVFIANEGSIENKCETTNVDTTSLLYNKLESMKLTTNIIDYQIDSIPAYTIKFEQKDKQKVFNFYIRMHEFRAYDAYMEVDRSVYLVNVRDISYIRNNIFKNISCVKN